MVHQNAQVQHVSTTLLRGCADIQKWLLLLRKLYHTPPPQHYKFNPSARQNTHLRPHMYKMLCLARETHLPCNTKTHFSHTTPRRGISSPQPMLANAQTAVHKREPFATTKVFGKNLRRKKDTTSPLE